jgi:hypothetical protein
MISNLVVHNQKFNWGARTDVMGILDVTPDRFSGAGLMAGEHAPITAAVRFSRGFPLSLKLLC